MITALWLLAIAGASARGADFTIRTPYWLVRGSGAEIRCLRADPAGHGEYSQVLATRIGPEAVLQPGRLAEMRPDKVVIADAAAIAVQYRAGAPKPKVPIQLEEGGSIGVLIDTDRDGLCFVGFKTPTWTRRDSEVTVQVRRGGPSGPVIARHRAVQVVDNGWTGFYFPPQPRGRYFAELVEPKGPVGCWAAKGTKPPGWMKGMRFFVNGRELTDMWLNIAVEWGELARGHVTVSADGPTLTWQFEPIGQAAPPAMVFEHPWVAEGFEISPRTTPFRAYVTDNFQYLPAHQLKRRARPEIILHPSGWLGLLGTGPTDLKLSPLRGGVEINLSLRRLSLRLPTCRITIEATAHGELWLRKFPRFVLPDRQFARDWNTFFLERAFSYPPIKLKTSADWHEWRARMLYWMDLPGLLEEDLPYLVAYWMTPDGYVHTWGSKPEWPFPDNEKYDARHFTTNAMYILGCWRAYCWSGDSEFLARIMPRLRRAMRWQLVQCRGAEGLFIDNSPDHRGTKHDVHSNYWDDIPFGYKSAYENVYFYASLLAMAELEEAWRKLPASVRDNAAGPQPYDPGYLRRLARLVHRNFDAAFWAGDHYIATVDILGKRHDYGISYVNLEAFAYGLGDRDKARRFYRWLETVRTETGQADMYAFEFAPRVNAWDLSKDWWYLDGKDVIPPQRWGTHLENGGAILYTSHFDLCARSMHLGPDNALQRARAILNRWRLPDHLSGGAPLFTGQHAGWATGTDIPFSESGLVPVSILYCFLGVNAHADGLHIKPNLPSSWPWAGVRGLRWRGLSMDLLVKRAEGGWVVRIEVKSPAENACTREWFVPAGRELVLSRPPRGEFPPGPLRRGWLARWIWVPGQSHAPDSRCFARRELTIRERPRKAQLRVAVDNHATVYVDGKRVGTVDGWIPAVAFDVTDLLSPGRHAVAIEARNSDGPAGVIAEVRVMGADGNWYSLVGTDEDWRVSPVPTKGWRVVGFDDSGWQRAEAVAPYGGGPWGGLEVAPAQARNP